MRNFIRSKQGLLPHFRNRYLFLFDLTTLTLSAYLAFVVRLESFDLGKYAGVVPLFALLSVSTRVALFFFMGGYSRYWPLANMPELLLIGQAIFLGELVTALALYPVAATGAFVAPPRSVPFLDLLFGGLAMALPRLGLRVLHYFYFRRTGEAVEGGGKRVLIVGAGEGGWMILQEIRKNPPLGLIPVGFVDDDEAKQNLLIHGVRVLGSVDQIPELVGEYGIQQVLIAIPSATTAQMRQIVEGCRRAEVEPLTLPGVYELISGNVRIERFRPVQVEDLLAREPVQTDTTRICLTLQGKRVLVTGAGGSIGSEICRQVARCRPASLTLLGHGENSIFHAHAELRRDFPDLPVLPLIADVRDGARVGRLFERCRPEIIFHAAAHKHVPLMERNPEEAVTNNVGGTRNLLRAAEETGCPYFVMISTDKAVNPTSVMGATKRVAEQLVQETAQRTGRRFVAVRFGNVLGSRGSVVPFFEAQIKDGGPVTVTHPEVKRYFMTIPEAVQLVLQAAVLGQGGELFVLDMGEPVKIVDLAQDMIRLAGLEVGRDIEVVFTGLRPGEKLFEELFLAEEAYVRTTHEKIFVCRNGHCGVSALEEQVEALLEAARAGDQPTLFTSLIGIVPEYSPPSSPLADLERAGFHSGAERIER